MTDELDAGTLEFAHHMLDLAREGETDELAEYVDAGLPRCSGGYPPSRSC